jgi:hypothetical protein
MIKSSAPRGFIALCLAAVIAFAVLAGLTWEEWQLIGWAVILGGGALALTANGRQNEVLAAAAPALTFFAGYTLNNHLATSELLANIWSTRARLIRSSRYGVIRISSQTVPTCRYFLGLV